MLRRREVTLLRKSVLGIGRTDIVSGAETEKCGVVMRLDFLAEIRGGERLVRGTERGNRTSRKYSLSSSFPAIEGPISEAHSQS